MFRLHVGARRLVAHVAGRGVHALRPTSIRRTRLNGAARSGERGRPSRSASSGAGTAITCGAWRRSRLRLRPSGAGGGARTRSPAGTGASRTRSTCFGTCRARAHRAGRRLRGSRPDSRLSAHRTTRQMSGKSPRHLSGSVPGSTFPSAGPRLPAIADPPVFFPEGTPSALPGGAPGLELRVAVDRPTRQSLRTDAARRRFSRTRRTPPRRAPGTSPASAAGSGA